MIAIRFISQLLTGYASADDYIRWGWWLLSMPIGLVIIIHAPVTIIRHWEDRKKRSIRSLILIAAVLIGADIAYYAQAVSLRRNVNPAECAVKGPSPYGPYEALVCVTAGISMTETEGFVLLKSTADGSVLASRDFYNPVFTSVSWGPDYLSVGTSEGSARFKLPPTRWDWVRARIP
jgi:hypothetical protein